jgi:hypothetical protein
MALCLQQSQEDFCLSLQRGYRAVGLPEPSQACTDTNSDLCACVLLKISNYPLWSGHNIVCRVVLKPNEWALVLVSAKPKSTPRRQKVENNLLPVAGKEALGYFKQCCLQDRSMGVLFWEHTHTWNEAL